MKSCFKKKKLLRVLSLFVQTQSGKRLLVRFAWDRIGNELALQPSPSLFRWFLPVPGPAFLLDVACI